MLQLGQLDRTDDRPPYRQIAALLREAIDLGALAPGEKLPSETALTQHFGVARMTVRHAILELRGEGLVAAEHGRGVFVRAMPPVRRLASDRFARKHRAGSDGKAAFLVEAEKAGYTADVDQLRIFRDKASEGVAERLRLPLGSELVVRERRYLANGRPIEIATSYLPAVIAGGTAIEEPDPGPGGIYARVEEVGHQLTRFTEEVGARMPSPNERKTLELGASVPVLTVVRTAFDAADVAVEVCDTVKVASAYKLEYDFPAR
ncbi:GntR family transcriptional regulator [Tamaricihabitans halophyticus]|uniref:GntR family transcriptional regulator n=1 Tax=Tamaricihabitans halophyticus TaxID=1262583 RepID=A0A4R2QJF5_9PSEU|nr:GntR family transcriptional regulator [Tamaricihabitans halophyticus]TCP48618.1 GntR family transcriptional regulator [Tamaricihabitans halophyticus]